MSKRRLGVLALALGLLMVLVAAPAAAGEAGGGGEEGGGAPAEDMEMEEVGTGSETAKEFRPEPFEQPALFDWFIYPLAAIGIIAVLVVLGLYLYWQPQFGRESQKRR